MWCVWGGGCVVVIVYIAHVLLLSLPLSPGLKTAQTPMEPIRSLQLPVGPEYVPAPLGIRLQDIVPEYEKNNPMMMKLVDTHRALSDNKQQLVKSFEEIDSKKTGILSRKEFVEGLKEANAKCRMNIPRVLMDDMCEEAAHMFSPPQDPTNPHDIIYYNEFVSALQPPPHELAQTLEQAFLASIPAARMARTSRFIERPRQLTDFSILERQKAHVYEPSSVRSRCPCLICALLPLTLVRASARLLSLHIKNMTVFTHMHVCIFLYATNPMQNPKRPAYTLGVAAGTGPRLRHTRDVPANGLRSRWGYWYALIFERVAPTCSRQWVDENKK